MRSTTMIGALTQFAIRAEYRYQINLAERAIITRNPYKSMVGEAGHVRLDNAINSGRTGFICSGSAGTGPESNDASQPFTMTRLVSLPPCQVNGLGYVSEFRKGILRCLINYGE